MINMIKKLGQNNVFLQNKHYSLILSITDKVAIAYLGKHQKDDVVIELKDKFNKHASSDVLDLTDTIFSSWSDGSDLEPMVKLEDEVGNYVHRFYVDHFELIDDYVGNFEGPHSRKKDQTLVITYLDETKRLRVDQYISTHHKSEAFAFSLKITNLSSDYFKLTKAMSFQLDLEGKDNTLYTLDGAWSCERNITTTNITNGMYAIKSASGMSSNTHNPFVILRHDDLYVASNLIYSGSHAETLEVLPLNKTRFMTGLNEHVFNWTLLKDQSFVTPEAVVTFGHSVDDVSMKMHEFVKHNIIPESYQNRKPHVLLNSWEGIYFSFDREKILRLAKTAKEVGADLFVLDDGWFGKRDDDFTSLGDWFDYKEKTGGLASLVEEIKNLGLKFGLWFEPEMINKKSKLYEEHPDFAMEIPHLNPIERRHQLMLDFSREDVRNHIFDMMSKVIDDIKPDYLKLDANRNMTDIYSKDLNNHGEYQHRYVLGLYDFWGKLVSRYPHILVEACSSGGNRFDLGTLYYFPQIWVSDNTDALSRIYMQEGTLLGYPQSTMGTHVSHVPNATTNRQTPLESRFNIASIGAFGYEMDMTKLPQNELDTIKKQIAFYREHSDLIFHGIYERLSSAYTSNVYAYVIKDKKEDFDKAILMIAQTKVSSEITSIRIGGFDPEAMYKISYRGQDNIEDVSSILMLGKNLNQYDFEISNLYEEENKAEKNDTIASRILVIEKVM